jgi:uncharacterized RDD family membrane protein YckC
MEQQSLLSEVEFTPVLASTGQRFLNYLIDVIVFYLVIIFGIGVGLYGMGGNGFTTYSSSSDSFLSELEYRIIFLLVYAFLYCLTEIILGGRTIGKLITGTKAVNMDGSRMEPKTILIRSLSRAVPFEQFSAFGSPCYPWHDKWSKTYVIDVRKTRLNDVNQF